MTGRWMIYGANGYSGRLIAEEAVSRGHQPVLAGRTESQVMSLADTLDVSYQVFDLIHQKKIKDNLVGVDLLLNCAGPFSETAQRLQEACLKTGTHYLDITGEHTVLESSYALHQQARKCGIVVISGVGFDVMAMDALAYELKQELPTATHLELAVARNEYGKQGMSPGAFKTRLNAFVGGRVVREGGELKDKHLVSVVKDIPFSDKTRRCVSIPSGEIVTAFYSTDTPNVTVYGSMEGPLNIWLPRLAWGLRLLRLQWFKSKLFRCVDGAVYGPDEAYRKTVKVQLWARVWVEGDHGDVLDIAERTQEVANEYFYTVVSSLMAVEHVLAHKVMPGAYTPSQVIDGDRILALASCDAEDVKNKSDLLQPEIDIPGGEFNHFDNM